MAARRPAGTVPDAATADPLAPTETVKVRVFDPTAARVPDVRPFDDDTASHQLSPADPRTIADGDARLSAVLDEDGGPSNGPITINEQATVVAMIRRVARLYHERPSVLAAADALESGFVDDQTARALSDRLRVVAALLEELAPKDEG